MRVLSFKQIIALWVSLLLSLAALGAFPSRAEAAPAPIQQPPGDSITADALPTVQVNGVVWAQEIVGNKVFAGGSFTRARPAGAAPGTNETVRNNLLAFDVTTGNLDTSFAPDLNGQVLGMALSPDQTRLYVVGDFTTANGQARRRVAAYHTGTGALITTFNPVGVNSRARDVAATSDAVYVGGSFQGAGSAVRANFAAFRASDGGLLPWSPSADLSIWGMATPNDGSAVFAGGHFTTVNGQPAYGLAKIEPATGALDTSWQPAVRNAGNDAAVGSLRVQGPYVYGTTWHFGPGGNLEGTFKVPVSNSALEWVTDCHGDNYSAFVSEGTVYTAGHAHYCGNMGGGFPQYPTWRYQHAMAWSDTVTGDILNDVHGYANWAGKAQGPAMINWLPDMAIGSFTGQSQAGWSVVGNNDYIVYGGEFPRVNGTNQQGLVRFGKRPVAPNAQGPRFVNGVFTPQVIARSTTSARVTWPAGFDRDDRTLTYRVIRDGAWGSPRHVMTADSNWWTFPALGYVDTGLTPGATYRYQIVAADPHGNQVFSTSTTYTAPASVPALNPYAQSVIDNGASLYWPLNDTRSGSPMPLLDWAGFNDGVADTDVTAGQPGALPGDTAMAVGTAQPNQSLGRAYAKGAQDAPDTFTIQVWINSTTTAGGRIFGFSDLQQGNSGHRDRHLYMSNDGRIHFGVRAQDNSTRTVASTDRFNDGQWHMLTASMSPQGMALYVDGVRVARRTDTTQGETYLGQWRLQGDNLTGWPSRPTSNNYVGRVDEVAVYPTALSDSAIIALYEASGRSAVTQPPPTDAYGAAVYADDPDLYWRLAETSGTTAADSGRSRNAGTYRNGVTLGAPGVIEGNAAARFDGSNDLVSSNAQFSNPTTYSLEAWFRTTSTSGGKIIGFGSSQTGNSSNYDRHVYMLANGRVVFGVWTGVQNTIESSNSYNDGEWHHVVATQSGAGMRLFVDSEPVGTHPQTAAQAYNGYWRIGGDSTWSGAPYLNGTIDEVAVYPRDLSLERVRAHYGAAGGQLNDPPTAAFTWSADQRRVTFTGTGSDPDGTVTGYAWDFGGGAKSTEQNPVHVFPAGTHNVTLTVTDNRGGTGSVSRDVTVTSGPAPADAYGAAVFADSPQAYWRMGETGGNKAEDVSGAKSLGTYFGSPTFGAPGGPEGAGTAVLFNSAGAFVASDDVYDNPTVYSQEAWFKTATTTGGKILGFGNNRTGLSTSYDRHVTMQADGKLQFGTWTGQMNTITTTKAYNDNQWHHVVATQSASGMKLYVDGELAGTNPQAQAQAYSGYWKVGGDTTWSDDAWFDGTIDEVALYLTELSGSRVAAHYAAAQPAPNQPPVAAFELTPEGLRIDVDASSSTDPDGEVTGWAWDFGDNSTGTGVTASHTYAQPGTYTVTLTVTDDDNATGQKTREVTVAAPTVQLASDEFNRQVTDGWGTADVGGDWSTSATRSNFAVGDGVGTIRMAAGAGPWAYLNSVSGRDVELNATVSYDKPGSGGGIYTSLIVRRASNSDYRTVVRVTATATEVQLRRVVTGTETVLSSVVLPGGALAAGEELQVKMQAVGDNGTALRAKVWRTGSPEPEQWTVTATDATPALQVPGAVGVYSYLSGSAINAPIVARFGSLHVVSI